MYHYLYSEAKNIVEMTVLTLVCYFVLPLSEVVSRNALSFLLPLLSGTQDSSGKQVQRGRVSIFCLQYVQVKVEFASPRLLM